MSLIRVDRHPSRVQLAVFSALCMVFFAAAGAATLIRGGSWGPAIAFWTAATLVPLAGGLLPGGVRYLYLASLYVTFPLGWVLSHLVLLAVYYLVLTPSGCLMRLLGHDPLDRRFDRDAETYWVPREGEPDVERYFRQF